MPNSRVVLIIAEALNGMDHLRTELASFDTSLVEAKDSKSGLGMFRRHAPALVVLNLCEESIDGADFLRRVRVLSSIPVICLTHVGGISASVEAVRCGATACLTVPVDLDRLVPTIEAFLEEPVADASEPLLDAGGIVGLSPSMSRVRRQAEGIAPLGNLPVWVWGEPGTGRGHVVTSVLSGSGRSSDGCVKISAGVSARSTDIWNCGAIHLDGIEMLSVNDQQFLAKTYSASSDGLLSDLPRLFASASDSLENLVASGNVDPALAAIFRWGEIRLPPLRERLSDIAQLAPALVSRLGSEVGRADARVTVAAIARLKQYSWPGNVRELSEILEQSVVFSTSGVIGPREVAEALRSSVSTVRDARQRREEAQRRRLTELLQNAGGNLAEVARELGLSRSTVHYRAMKFGLIERRDS